MPLRATIFRLRGGRAVVSRWPLVVLVVVAILATHYLGDLDPFALIILLAITVLAVIHLTRHGRQAPPASLPDAEAVIAYLDRATQRNGAVPGVIVIGALRAEAPAGGRRDPEDVIAAADALRAVLRPEDVIARTREGALAVALSMRATSSLEELIQIALRLQRRLQAPVHCDGRHVRFDAAVGICGPAAPDAIDGRAALSAATAALTLARADHPNAIRMAQRQSNPEAPLALQLATDLDRAFAENEIVPFFQPQVSTDTGLLTGLEALARWIHPEHGTLAPGHFLPTIDAAGANAALTETILAQSLRALAEWDARGFDVPRISINVTHADLVDPTLMERVEWMLDRYGIGADRLCIEVLETVLSVPGSDTVPRTLGALRDLGCRIDLDDFGTGQASIASIRKFCIDRLKIDRSFVRNLDKDTDQQGMVAAIVTMAEHLGLDVVAEGVETTGEHARAAELGCTHVQGYGIGRPMRADAFDGWVSRWRRDRSAHALPDALQALTKTRRPRSQDTSEQRGGNGKTA